MYFGRLIGLWNKTLIRYITIVIKLMQACNKISNGLKSIAGVSFHQTEKKRVFFLMLSLLLSCHCSICVQMREDNDTVNSHYRMSKILFV